jgi:hypothetical protein
MHKKAVAVLILQCMKETNRHHLAAPPGFRRLPSLLKSGIISGLSLQPCDISYAYAAKNQDMERENPATNLFTHVSNMHATVWLVDPHMIIVEGQSIGVVHEMLLTSAIVIESGSLVFFLSYVWEKQNTYLVEELTYSIFYTVERKENDEKQLDSTLWRVKLVYLIHLLFYAHTIFHANILSCSMFIF